MGAPTQYYCDPAGDADSGAGTIGDPFLDLQYALNNITRDSSNGDRINIKASTDEVLSSGLTLATYGTPALHVPLIFQGYTTSQGDGGQAGVNCGGSNGLFASTSYDAIQLIDMHIHNGGSAALLEGDDYWAVYRCEVNNTTGNGINLNQACVVIGNNIYNIAGEGIGGNIIQVVIGWNYLANGTNDFSAAISAGNNNAHVNIVNNIISIDGSSNGIVVEEGTSQFVANNSILCAGGTGTGIAINDTMGGVIVSNLVEGFSGSGGVGISQASGEEALIVRENALYNNATNYSLGGTIIAPTNDNETLSASPFAKSGADTFANRFTYFAPVDTGNVIGGAFVG